MTDESQTPEPIPISPKPTAPPAEAAAAPNQAEPQQPAVADPATAESAGASTEEPAVRAPAQDAGAAQTAGAEKSTGDEAPSGGSGEGRTRFNIRIGSARRPTTSESPDSSAPPAESSAGSSATETATADAAASPPPAADAAPVELPSSDDVDAELEAALAGGSVEQLMEQSAATVAEIPLETRRQATMVRHDNEHVFFSLGGPHEGAVPLRQFEEPPAPGSELDVIVTGYNADDGLYELSIPGASVEVADWTDIVEGNVVEVRITGSNTGGLECKLSEAIRGFIPASQIALYRVENLNEYLGKKLLCVITKVSKKGKHKNVVLSHRAILEREKEEERKKKLESIEPGQVVEGTVANLREFGAFVDIGGLDGLLHVSQLSWERVKHPSDVLEVGQKIRVKIEKVNKQTGKISLSYKALSDHPWTNVDQRFPPQSTVTGTVTRVAQFGAFVKLAPGVEGMIHISELAHRRVGRVEDVVQEGQEVTCKILSVDADKQRIALSIKALEAEPERESEPAEEEAPAPPRKRGPQKPLRGGLDRPAGGEKFGLKW